MRLFTGIDLPEGIKDNLDRVIAAFRPAAKIGWNSRKNFHITTKFIGEWPEERLAELKGALSALPSRDLIEIGVRGLGWFPNPRSPRVFWAGVVAPAELAELARETDEALARFGVPPESRAFSPHLTLARIRQPVPLAALHAAIAKLSSDEFGAFRAERFSLFLSELQPSGSVYTKLGDFPFARS